MTTTDTETAQEIMQRLATMEVECPYGGCTTCKGSGQISRFETLREECLESFCDRSSSLCQGKHWILPPEAEWRPLIEDIALEMRWEVRLITIMARQLCTLLVSGKYYVGRDPDSDTTTNLLRAFIQAVEAEDAI